MKRITLLIAMLCTMQFAFTQTVTGYYYGGGQKNYFTDDVTSVNIIVRNMNNYNTIVANLQNLFNQSNDEILYDDEDNNIIVNSTNLVNYTLSQLKTVIQVNSDDIEFISYSKVTINDQSKIWLTNEVLLKLEDNKSISDVQTIIQNYSIDTIEPLFGQWSSIKCLNESDVITLSSDLYTSSNIQYASPDFYNESENQSTIDPMYNYQFYLKNIGQWMPCSYDTDGDGFATFGIDINIEDAWKLSKGNSTIRVAVIDDGVEEHEDLEDINGVTRVRNGYTPSRTPGIGLPLQNGYHGQNCAGIIAASHNNIGIEGIAPNIEIVPIRIAKKFGKYSSKKKATAIRKAWEDLNCDILSNSWIDNKSTADIVFEAFSDAMTYGRGGKGCTVVFSSGNYSSSFVANPGNLDGVISVGAVNMNGNWTYSNYGSTMSVVAPVDTRGDVFYPNVRTIDRMGSFGTNSGNYKHDFGGTSAACPQVAGIVALMLSVNTDLTSDEVKNIIQSAANNQILTNYTFVNDPNHPNGLWNTKVAYGLINGGKAVLASVCKSKEIVGDEDLNHCNRYTYSIDISNFPSSSYVVWETSDNLDIVSTTNSSTVEVVGIIQGGGYIDGKVYVGSTYYKIRKNVNVLSGLTYPIKSDFYAIGSDTYTNDQIFRGTYIVGAGADLTIHSNIYCFPSTKIIVQKGGKLVLDGGTIKGVCDEMWQGIIVEGDASLPQTPIYNQGYVTLINGAVIENAQTAIRTLNPTGIGSTNGGGVIRITNSTLRNNVCGVKMSSYVYYNSLGAKKPDISYFGNSTFETTNQIVDGIQYPTTFFDLDGVNKVRIQNCTLKNSYDNNTANQNHGWGVTTYNTNVLVDNCTFESLERGVYLSATSPLIPASIKNSTFTDNTYACYMNSVDYANFIENTINVPNDPAYGLYMDNSTEYTIENNSLSTTSGNMMAVAGMVINNSGSNANQVYNNTFSNLTAGLLAQHDNWGNSVTQGLHIKCNDFTNSMQDVAITEDVAYTGTTGISVYQGANISQSSLAGNTFSHSGSSIYFGTNPYSDYNNEKGGVISAYYHHNGTVSDSWLPKYYTNGDPTTGNPLSQTQIIPVNVPNMQYYKSTACPDQQDNGGGTITLSGMYSAYNASKVNQLSSQLILSIWEDGGNPNLPDEVALAYPWETYQLYNDLMLESPYLSDGTLIEAINNTGVLPTNLLKLVLLANPQCSRSSDVMDALYNRMPPMPESDIEDILDQQNDYSPLDGLKADVSYYTSETQRSARKIKQYYMNDTVSTTSNDSLMAFLGREDYPNAAFQLAYCYFSDGDYAQLDQLLQDIPNDFELSDEEEITLQQLEDFLEIMEDIETNNKAYTDLTTSQQDDLLNLANDNRFFTSAYARSYLIKNSPEYSYTESVIFPVITSSRYANPEEDDLDDKKAKVSLYPNPAHEYFSINYDMESVEGRFIIIDMSGKKIMEKKITKSRGTEVIGVSAFSSGTYIMSFYVGEELVKSIQFNIQK